MQPTSSAPEDLLGEIDLTRNAKTRWMLLPANMRRGVWIDMLLPAFILLYDWLQTGSMAQALTDPSATGYYFLLLFIAVLVMLKSVSGYLLYREADTAITVAIAVNGLLVIATLGALGLYWLHGTATIATFTWMAALAAVFFCGKNSYDFWQLRQSWARSLSRAEYRRRFPRPSRQ